MNLSEIRELPEATKLFKLGAAALLLWLLAFALFLQALGIGSQSVREIDAAERVINAAVVYKSYPSVASAQKGNEAEDPYAVTSEVVSSLNLDDRILQLATQSSQASHTPGVLLQIERLYGEEMAQLVTLFESQGLLVRTAEIRAMPVGKERLLSGTFSLEAAK